MAPNMDDGSATVCPNSSQLRKKLCYKSQRLSPLPSRYNALDLAQGVCMGTSLKRAAAPETSETPSASAAPQTATTTPDNSEHPAVSATRYDLIQQELASGRPDPGRCLDLFLDMPPKAKLRVWDTNLYEQLEGIWSDDYKDLAWTALNEALSGRHATEHAFLETDPAVQAEINSLRTAWAAEWAVEFETALHRWDALQDRNGDAVFEGEGENKSRISGYDVPDQYDIGGAPVIRSIALSPDAAAALGLPTGNLILEGTPFMDIRTDAMASEFMVGRRWEGRLSGGVSFTASAGGRRIHSWNDEASTSTFSAHVLPLGAGIVGEPSIRWRSGLQ